MRRLNRLVAPLLALFALIFVSAIALAQPMGMGTSGEQGGQGSMMGGGMGMGGMGGMGGGEAKGTGKMAAGCGSGMEMMGMTGMMEMMRKDPKLKGRMMELRGEMMRLMGDALIKRGKELQEGKRSEPPAPPASE